MSERAVESHAGAPAAGRLVIRVKLIPQAPVEPATPWRSDKRAPLILGAVVAALVLGWVGFSAFSSDPPPAPATIASAPQPAPEPSLAKPVEPEVPPQPEGPPSTIKEVVPDVPQSALDTIRGTIRVVIRVTLDKHGTVVDATADEPGPSRYFLRLATEASKQWTFTPARSDDRRTMSIRFHFTRDGASARLSDATPH